MTIRHLSFLKLFQAKPSHQELWAETYQYLAAHDAPCGVVSMKMCGSQMLYEELSSTSTKSGPEPQGHHICNMHPVNVMQRQEKS